MRAVATYSGLEHSDLMITIVKVAKSSNFSQRKVNRCFVWKRYDEVMLRQISSGFDFEIASDPILHLFIRTFNSRHGQPNSIVRDYPKMMKK